MNQTTNAQPANRGRLTGQMQQTLEHFDQAGRRIEEHYRSLSGRVERLSGELENSNQELRRNLHEKERMQAILISSLQSLTVGVLAVGQDGVVIVANPAACRLLGRALTEVAAQPIECALPETSERDELLLTLQGALGEQRRVTWRRRLDEDQQERMIELAAVRALPPYDRQLAGLILLEDVTTLRRLEQQAARQSRLAGMGEIAMNLAHEIRNPLGSIALFATALERELQGNGSLGPLAAQIVNGVKSLEHLVANTLEFARPRRMAMARVNLAQVIADTLVYVQHPLAQKEIGVIFDHDLTPEAWIAGDAEQLRQVFLNLFINAIQAMLDGGRLEIELHSTEEGGWEVVVRDDGVGIPAELLDRIFDPFFTTREKGSGIGLAVVHTILAAHGARVTVESRVAAGAEFRIGFAGEAMFEGAA